MKMIGMFKGLLLAGLIASLASMANGQSNGRWIGRTQISPSTATQSPAGVDGVRGDAEAQTNQGADQVALSSKKPTIVGSWVLTVSVPTLSTVVAFCVTAPLMSALTPSAIVPAVAFTLPSATVVASRTVTAVPAFVVLSRPARLIAPPPPSTVIVAP